VALSVPAAAKLQILDAVPIYIDANATKKGTYVTAGGLLGANGGFVEQCYATGSVTITKSSSISTAGGLVGFNDGTIGNSYSKGAATVNGTGTASVGGLVGRNDMPIAQSYSTGAPPGNTGTYVGGLIGYDVYSDQLSNDYLDITTSGITNLSQGAGNVSDDPGITGETTTQLQ
jgi:hypothetical protein